MIGWLRRRVKRPRRMSYPALLAAIKADPLGAPVFSTRSKGYPSAVEALEAAGLDPDDVEITSIDGGPVMTISEYGSIFTWDSDGNLTRYAPSAEQLAADLFGPEYGISTHDLVGDAVTMDDVLEDIRKLDAAPPDRHVIPAEVLEFCGAAPWWWGAVGSRRRRRRHG